jgi:RNA polymerase sigma factor (sigma-70 family)
MSMKQRIATTTRRSRNATAQRSKTTADQPTKGIRSSTGELLYKADVLEAAPDGLMTEELWGGLDSSGPEHRALAREAGEAPDLNVPEDLLEAKSADLEAEEETTRVVDPVLIYLQEAGTIPLLTAADEVRLARQMESAKARLSEILGRCLGVEPQAAAPEGERWRTECLRQVQGWMTGLERGAVEVQRDSGLSSTQLRQLWAELQPWQEALEEARATLVSANLRLVVTMAKQHLNRGLPLLDLIQEGNLGLLRAVETFDYRLGFRVNTYASWWIRQGMNRALAKQGRIVRPPVRVGERIGRLKRTAESLRQQLEREPTIEEMAQALDICMDEAHTLVAHNQAVLSLEAYVSEEGRVMDFIADRAAINPAEIAIQEELSEYLQSALQELNPREQFILRARFGLDNGQMRTLEDIGQELQLSRERVRQLEAQALGKVRDSAYIPQLASFLDM